MPAFRQQPPTPRVSTAYTPVLRQIDSLASNVLRNHACSLCRRTWYVAPMTYKRCRQPSARPLQQAGTTTTYRICNTMDSMIDQQCPTRYTSKESLLKILKKYFNYMSEEQFELTVRWSEDMRQSEAERCRSTQQNIGPSVYHTA